MSDDMAIASDPIIRMADGSIWMLVTNSGGNDPEGHGGYVIGELGGSGCRWVAYDPTDRAGSMLRLKQAQAWHRDHGTDALD